jgi:hypothetical protein
MLLFGMLSFDAMVIKWFIVEPALADCSLNGIWIALCNVYIYIVLVFQAVAKCLNVFEGFTYS